MPKYIKGVELTQDGMRAIFERMGKDITSGIIYNGNPDIRVDVLNQQGFMPILTGVSPTQESGHWIMLIKGQGNNYYLFDPLGEGSGNGYKNILSRKLPQDATLSVIPNGSGYNMGLCGYWVASAGVRAHTALTGDNPPTLENLGQTITQEMQQELDGNGYNEIAGWLQAVANEFPAGDAQTDATALRRATEKDLHIETPTLTFTGKTTTFKEVPTQPTAPQTAPSTILNSNILENDVDVQAVVDYIHKEYLRHPYPGPLKNPKDPTEGRLPPNEGPDRTTHGLAHTVRTMACAEVMVEEARKAKFRGEKLGTAQDGRTLADVTPEELKKILIAQAFFVVGRDDERSGYDETYDRDFYEEYHKKSEQAFRKYVEDNKLIGKIFKDQKEVDHYAAIVLDERHSWDQTPAHILINQGHMVDLMRVKSPSEVVVERAYNTLTSSVGPLGAEVVLRTHREFFLATGSAVPSFNPQAKENLRAEEPYENMVSQKYVIEKGKTINSIGEAQRVPSDYRLKDNERFVTIREHSTIEENNIHSEEAKKLFKEGGAYENPYSGEKYAIKKGKELKSINDIRVINSKSPITEDERLITIKEYYSLPEIQNKFPGYNTQLAESPATDFSRTCELQPLVCLGAIKEARQQINIGAIKEVLQASTDKKRKQPNIDEIAAARIIHQIMSNPEVIQNDHVLLNGKKLEEQFFRDLLAKCDMAVVGSLLNEADINNIDRLMQHEKDTEFHSTDPKAVPVKIGETWDEEIRKKGGEYRDKIKHDLIFLMQNDAWYFSRVNAIAQNRDKGSTFKEVMFTALLTPLTSKALVDTHGRASSPKLLYRGLSFSEDFQNKLINQANTIIANSAKHLFTDLSAQDFMQIKLNDLSKISAKTNASNSVNIEVPRTIFDSNTIFEINDPEGLLQAKQVGTHVQDSEDEFSFYLPDDVALVPTKVTLDGKTSTGADRYIFTFMTIKSPDFIHRHESGFAVTPFINIQNAKVLETINAVKAEVPVDLEEKLFALQLKMVEQFHLPIRGGFLDKVLHYFSGKDDKKISLERKIFLNEKVIPKLRECHNALRLNNMDMLQRALATFPSDKEWSKFKSDAAKAAKMEMDNLRPLIEKKIALQRQLTPLMKCQDALEKQQVTEALTALENIPSDNEMSNIPSISSTLREQIQSTKRDVVENLTPLQHAAITPVLINIEQVRKRYESLKTSITQRITSLGTANLDDVTSIKKELVNFNALQEEVKVLRNEKARLDSQAQSVDFTDAEKLEEQLRTIHTKLYDAYVVEVAEEINILEEDKPKNLTAVKKMISSFNERLAEVEQLRQEKTKIHGASTDPLNLSDVDALKERLQKVNQFLTKVLISNIRVSLNQMEVKTFEAQAKEAQLNLQLLDKLATTLDDSDTAKKHKAEIVKLNEFFVEKQKAYPAMVQLQFKSEALIIQLRELCEIHQINSAKSRKTRTEELTKNRWMLQGLTDLVGLTKDERITLAKKGTLLDKFKKDLNNDKYDIQELINILAKRSPDQLEEATGISSEGAVKLHALLKNLSHSTTFVAKIEERAKLSDEVFVELNKAAIQNVVKEELQKTLEL
ncbi:SidE phosphodiesterase domain-containing protein [Legionella longbeachae]|uniref:Homologous to SidE substrate of Dot/Icm secretion system n=1 Tax=Legionella longbeachae serogroup 1 (strain NSW150) TaxID=661367 RepID=D3HM54_LEGLN|nr:SidE phosphodiesterase domain-containing protein [Legionella longbeachae]VEE03966.1 Homologous to SidE substrate of Dot/Icm secretion system [Legionella oakridgensis]HBD7397252.1 NAD-dependent ubiquitin ligase [Legionella pneumophila]ARB93178.1 septation initiation protein [Legionella longbeachae]EEZ97082.1 SidE [Legionella longbeachae D-4968]QIN33626.1 NAD-dependent ubiquitin ligase [Legionella longbeachae]